jgi:prephenate dehydrogenase
MKPLNHVLIVGIGLIGGSIGLALRERKLARKITGAGSRAATLDAALRLGAITDVAHSLTDAAAEAELVIVAAPVGQIMVVVEQLAAVCRPGTLITDVGSTKAEIVEALEHSAEPDGAWQRDVRFVGSHPLAGNEKTGPQHARADLFAGRTVVVTPTPRTRPQDTAAIAEFWTALGAQVRQLSPQEHDQALAATSHLPHLAASAVAAATPPQYVALTASGWQDTTRIAAGDPTLWRQIMLSNRGNLLASLDRLTAQLAQWRAALTAADAAELERLLAEAKRLRDSAGS